MSQILAALSIVVSSAWLTYVFKNVLIKGSALFWLFLINVTFWICWFPMRFRTYDWFLLLRFWMAVPL